MLFKKIERIASKLFNTRSYRLITIDEFARRENVPKKIIISEGDVTGSAPRFFGEGAEEIVVQGIGEFRTPNISIYELNKVVVVGWTDFILANREALYHGSIDVASDVFVAEMEHRGRLGVDQSSFHLWTKSSKLNVRRAISLLGQSTPNYSHWITEVMARLVLIDEFPEYKDYALLIDNPVHPNLYSALSILNRFGRPVFHVRAWQRVFVENLVYISPPSYTPPDDRTRWRTGVLPKASPSRSVFSPIAMGRLREEVRERAVRFVGDSSSSISVIERVSRASDGVVKGVLSHRRLDGSKGSSGLVSPRRLYFDRRASMSHNGRELLNDHPAKSMLSDFGFFSVDPQSISFDEQVTLMQDCECVVSGIGASLANLVFAPPGRTVIVLAPFYQNANYGYFANMMISLGHKVIFVVGPQVPEADRSIYQRKFRIDLSALRRALLTLEPHGEEEGGMES